MSLTSLINSNAEFRHLLDQFMPAEWYKSVCRDLHGLDPGEPLPPLLTPIQAGVLCDFAIRKLFRDGDIPCVLVRHAESGQCESVAGGHVIVPGDEHPSAMLGLSGPSRELLFIGEECLNAYLSKPLREALPKTVLLIEFESFARTRTMSIRSPIDAYRRVYEISQAADLIWAWLEPILTWAKKAFVGTNRVLLNPKFGLGSHLVEGADGDLWVNGTLYDIKCCKRVGRNEIRQVVGYAALAVLDARGNPSSFWSEKIAHVGMVLARQQVQVEWPVPGLVAEHIAVLGDWLEQRAEEREAQRGRSRERLVGVRLALHGTICDIRQAGPNVELVLGGTPGMEFSVPADTASRLCKGDEIHFRGTIVDPGSFIPRRPMRLENVEVVSVRGTPVADNQRQGAPSKGSRKKPRR